MPTSRHDERGVTLVILALSLTALMAVAGLAVDGGRLFVERRQNQNASDAAALAGAQVLRNELADLADTGTVTPDQVWTAVLATATSNSISSGNTTCYFIDTGYHYLPSDANPKACSSYTSTDAWPANAFGVYVATTETQNTSFMRIVGINQFNTSAHAAAATEAVPFLPTAGSSDLEVCAVGSSDGNSDGKGQTTTSGADIPILIPSGGTEGINPAAIGQAYWIKGNNVDKECGTNGNFKGLVCQPGGAPCPPDSVPGYWPSDTGNHSGPFRNTVAAECSSGAIGCTFALPLCYASDQGPPPQSGTMYCVTWGSFEITATTANSDAAVFTGQAFTQTGGQGGGIPGQGQPAVVRLVE